MNQTLRAVAKISDWRPDKQRYHISEVMRLHGLTSSQATAFALMVNDWKKYRIHTTERKRLLTVTWWASPRSPLIPQRRRGRPNHMEILYRAITGLNQPSNGKVIK